MASRLPERCAARSTPDPRLCRRRRAATIPPMAEPGSVRFLPLVLVTSLLTLLLTVARTLGEVLHWHPKWFAPDAGGALSPFGIVWLVPLVGLLFGRRAAQAGSRPPFLAAFAVPLAGLAVVVGAAGWMGTQLKGEELLAAMGWLVRGAPVVALLALFVWPRVFVLTLAYGVLARIPVAVVQWLDVKWAWGTHYGKVHPSLPAELTNDAKLQLLTLAQFGLWVPFTVLLGTAFAAVGAATVRRQG
jgi:hypothetical protein